DRGEGFLTTRQELHALQALARRLRDDLYAALERVVLVEERQARPAAAEQRAECLLEIAVDGGKGLRKALPRGLVDPFDGLGGLSNRVDEIFALGRQEPVPGLEFVELLDRHHVDRPQAVDLGAQPGDRLFGAQRTLCCSSEG